MSDPQIPAYDVDAARRDFPILASLAHGKPLCYLDNGASTQKPNAVIDGVADFYRHHNANIHRAVHHLSQHATDLFEGARLKVQKFLNASTSAEVIFTRGTTESINLVAHSFTRLACKPGDEILVTTLEHHSNIVPWQLAAEQLGLRLRVLPIDDRGEPQYDALPSLLSEKTKLVATTHASNALGTIVDVKRIVAEARKVGARVLVDGAQWVGHATVDVQDLGCDFYVFSGHKLFGPTGIGVLWGRRELLEKMPPYQGGGDMIRTVSFERTTYADLPNKFEAGTADISGAIGLGAAIDYFRSLGRAAVAAHERDLLEYATAKLSAIKGLRLVGTAPRKVSIVSFVLDVCDPHTLGTLLDGEGIAVRTGHHCCMPLMDRLGLSGTVRASFAFYNTRGEIDRLATAIEKIRTSFVKAPAQNKLQQNTKSELVFAPAMAASPDEAAAALAEDFDLFDDWDQKHEYLLDLGKKVPPLPDIAKIEPNKVRGCQSTVYFIGRKKPGTDDVIEFSGESDAFIVNGLIAILTTLLSGQRAADVLRFDIEGFFDRVGFSTHLSMGRRNGLAGMIQRVRLLARTAASEGTLAELKAVSR